MSSKRGSILLEKVDDEDDFSKKLSIIYQLKIVVKNERYILITISTSFCNRGNILLILTNILKIHRRL